MTIRHPPPAVEGIASDSAEIGTIHDISPQLAILMIAAGWMRNDTRSLMRRQLDSAPGSNRRQMIDRRSETGE